ncbi:hypothetical protein FOMPIDRAFT_83449 [Fomitopsis schrenkii]|uniref:Uncharacterized protein n=1 Tax=Fomitopsis schrenkii TaxID=2126942 RepID=S8DTD9_FOMSC|nr:hypothetical protein FOMPIDRAFT_83449 [Fomitopsis schrenkii]
MSEASCAVCSEKSGTKRALNASSPTGRNTSASAPPAAEENASSEPEVVPEGIEDEVARMRAYLAEVREISDKFLEGARARRGGPTSAPPDVKLLDKAREKLAGAYFA